MAHILPHWTWPEREGQITPVHVFTSGDEAELFLDGRSLGRKRKGPYEYRLRWDDVRYTAGELSVVAYKNGNKWAEDVVQTTGHPTKLSAAADRAVIQADGRDLSFVTVRVVDASGRTAPRASDSIRFQLRGPGEIVATDNGDPSDFTPFPSHERRAFHGLCLVIVRSVAGEGGSLELRATAGGLEGASVNLTSTVTGSRN